MSQFDRCDFDLFAGMDVLISFSSRISLYIQRVKKPLHPPLQFQASMTLQMYFTSFNRARRAQEKFEPKRHKDLHVTFECNTFEGHWSQTVIDVDIKDHMISFKNPTFPYQITEPVIVDIVLRQDDRILGVIKYSSLPLGQSE